MITAEIKLGNELCTFVCADTIEGVIKKIQEYHTMNEFDRDYYKSNGRLEPELNSGWYLKSA